MMLLIKKKIKKKLRSTNVRQASGIDDLPSRFLKNGSPVLLKPISELCNFSIKLRRFSFSLRLKSWNLYSKKGSKINPSNYRPISLLHSVSKIIKKIIHEQTSSFLSIYLIIKFYTTINKDFGNTTQQTHASRFCMIKFWKVLIRAGWLPWYWLTSKRHLTRLTMVYS